MFFLRRYEKLGWKHRDVELRQAIRINSISAPVNEVIERLQARRIELEKIPFLKTGYWINSPEFSIGATSEYLLGLYSIQEAASQIPATLFSSLKGKAVLDACAAPGGKTVQLANLMQNTGSIIALDIRKKRLRALANHLERCQIENSIVYHLDARRVSKLNTRFDRILLDVPCSGNFATDSDWFRKRTIGDVERNAKIQKEILREAVTVLKDDGEIVYSTCSLEPEENELNMDWAVRELDLRVEKLDCYGIEASTRILGSSLHETVDRCRRMWPGKTQGFFVAKLTRGS